MQFKIIKIFFKWLWIQIAEKLISFYICTETAYRKLSPDEYLPAIPCHPIGYGIAIHIMRYLQ